MTLAMRAVLSALAALALSGCAQAYGYGYCYDPLHGPKGFYYGPLEPKPACAREPARAGAFQGPAYGGWRGPFYAGPVPAP
jgi:hypothetical protein